MKNITIQIQSILYHNSVQDVEKALCHIANAVKVYGKHNDVKLHCEMHYGDSSKTPVFSEEDVESLKTRYPELADIRYQFFNENTGTAKGHNRLAEECKSDYMMVMNPDVLITPRFFMEMLEPFADRKVGLAEARQTPIEHPKEYDVNTFETGWAATACVIFPTDVYREVNGFDQESFFMYCDDVDFSWRIRLAGYKVIYRPRAMAYHAKRLSASGAWQPTQAERYYSAEAALFMAYKWSQNNLLNRLLRDFKKSNDDNLMKAEQEFKKRKHENRLPKQLDKEHKVAEFVEGNYAKHRFVL